MNTYENYPLISDQVTAEEIAVIVRELRFVLSKGIEGDIVELGCYEGTTSLFLQRELLKRPERKLWLYDSFEGLPKKTYEDQSPTGLQFKEGELRASKQQLILNFKKANLPVPRIKKAWFSELTLSDVPEKIAFAFLDGDYYESIKVCLKLIWPKLSAGAVVIVDDVGNEALPGAAKAVDEWLRSHSAQMRLEKSLAILRPL